MDRSRVPWGSGHHGDALILPLDVTHTGHGLCHHLAALRTGLRVQSGNNNISDIGVFCVETGLGLDYAVRLWDVTRLEIPLWLASLVLDVAWGSSPQHWTWPAGVPTPTTPAATAGWLSFLPPPPQSCHQTAGLVSSVSPSVLHLWTVWSWELSQPRARCRKSPGLSIPACLHSSRHCIAGWDHLRDIINYITSLLSNYNTQYFCSNIII